MDSQTLEALKGSIAKWEGIVAGTVTDEGTSNCPLCQKFITDDGSPPCFGCPVAEKTGQTWCGGSPYSTDWDQFEFLPDYVGGYDHSPESLAGAQAELDFLKSLLPVKS